MNYNIDEIHEVIGGRLLQKGTSNAIRNVIFDTRKSSFPEESIFFAFKGLVNDGHDYIGEAYRLGVRNFVISKSIKLDDYTDINVLKVNSCLLSLQKLAAYHRSRFSIPIIAITGSNGKTIVKEWLGKALSRKFRVCKSPKSYNSQLGVALSLLQLSDEDEIGVFEAGISRKNEMRFLERMLKPDIGIFTNIGDAHSMGFDSKADKLNEKLLLFRNSKTLIYCADQKEVDRAVSRLYPESAFPWSYEDQAPMQVLKVESSGAENLIHVRFREKPMRFSTPYKSREFIENLLHVITTLLKLDFGPDEINDIIEGLDQVSNRLELIEGMNNNLIINDSYSLDMSSLQLALEFQDMHADGMDKVLIISDFEQQSDKKALYTELSRQIRDKEIESVLAIGFDRTAQNILDLPNIRFFDSATTLLAGTALSQMAEKCILVKGARKYRLEDLFNSLARQVHQTVLECNFAALDHNINVYRSYLNENTGLMAVIKAEAYGSGTDQMARYLEKKQVDYLAVAIIDEGIQIRQAGVQLPIMVFNVHASQIDTLWQYNLEPEVYSFELLNSLAKKSEELDEDIYIHLKIDTGMKRLGFEPEEMDRLIQMIKQSDRLKIRTVFSHLAASESTEHDTFTERQIALFEQATNRLHQELDHEFQKHILNTAGIVRFNNKQFDMVRIGLGMYGVDETGLIADKLEKVHTLKARVLQVKTLEPGESTGYGRMGSVRKSTRIAIVSIGYADGIMRSCGNGRYHMRIGTRLCPTIGNICMDVCMLDITDADQVRVGDEVVVFDNQLPIESLASSCQTISYEIISRIAPRVKRSFTYL